MNDYLSAEALIIARLEETVPALRKVAGAAELPKIRERQQRTPAAYVVYQGDRVGVSTIDGKASQAAQRWIVAIAIHNAAGEETGAGVKEKAGPIILDVLKALQGYRPSTEHTPLKRTTAPAPLYQVGYGYFPLAFETTVGVVGTAQ